MSRARQKDIDAIRAFAAPRIAAGATEHDILDALRRSSLAGTDRPLAVITVKVMIAERRRGSLPQVAQGSD